MFLTGPGGRRVALCYSMNVHPGEGLDDVLRAIGEHVVPLRERMRIRGDFAVGLRLARRAAEETESRAGELKALLDRHRLVPVTANAFPFGDFHGERVKEEVYRPDWAEGARAVYTLRVAVALAATNRRGTRVSVSTLPLAWRASRCALNAVTGRVLEMINVLQAVERKSGVRVQLALEPEPLCLLEGIRDTIDYWTGQLMPACRARYGRGAEELARSYLGLCLDTCHFAVRWEDPAAALDAFRAAGIPVAKIQLSSALEAPSVEALAPFREPRYLHQVVGRGGEALPDLGEATLPGPVRCHFHVPVHRDRVGGLPTTRAAMTAGLAKALEAGGPDCLEIETYTWDVLPDRAGSLLDSLEEEYRFVLAACAAAGFRPGEET